MTAVDARFRALLGDGARTLVIRLAGSLLAVAYTLLLARWLGAAEYGAYSTVMTFVTIAAMLGGFGVPMLLVRRVAQELTDDNGATLAQPTRATVYGLLRDTSRVTLGALVLAAGAALTGLWLSGHLDAAAVALLVPAACMVLPLQSVNLRQSILLALRRHLAAALASYLLRPACFVLVLLISVTLMAVPDSAGQALLLQLLALLGSAVITAWLFRRVLPRPPTVPATEGLTSWYQAGLPFLLARLSRALWGRIELAALALLAPAEVLGHYALALLVANTLENVTDLQARLLMPLAARPGQSLERLAPALTRLCFWLVLPVVAALWLGGELLLELLGPSYAGALLPVQLLATAQLAPLAFGPAVTVLAMRGHQRQVAVASLLGALVLVVGALSLSPLAGAVGCALVHLLVKTGWSMWLWWQLRQREALRVDVLARAPAADPDQPAPSADSGRS